LVDESIDADIGAAEKNFH